MTNIKQHYIKTSIFLTNCFLIFIILSCIFQILYIFEKKILNLSNKTSLTKKYGEEVFKKAYPKYSTDQINILLKERDDLPLEYEPYTQFKEKAKIGTYYNISPFGYRIHSNNGPFPLDNNNTNIFIFGGSTSFGYGVEDNATIPAILQKKLQQTNKNIFVYNFGRGGYFSTQERILFENLIISGIQPDIAIFLDGLNDFSFQDNLPLHTKKIEKMFNTEGLITKQNAIKRLIESYPLIKIYQHYKQWRASSQIQLNSTQIENNNSIIEKNIQIYKNNIDLINIIAKAKNIKTYFFLQPIPTYKLDPKQHLFYQGINNQIHSAKFGYISLKKKIDSNKISLPQNFFWLADIQKNIIDFPLYIDSCHYSAEFSKFIAKKIAKELEKNI